MYSIGILENDIGLRETLEDFISINKEHTIAFSEGSFRDLKEIAHQCGRPDFVLLDIHLDDTVGLNIIDEIKFLFNGVNIIVITGDYDESLILKAIQNGASGYLYKPFSTTKLYDAIANIERTGSFLDPETLTKLMAQLNVTIQETVRNVRSDKELTSRENRVLELAKKGYTYKEMATEMNVSFHTINFHLKSIYFKMDVKSKAELISKFIN
jgi:DNA-binding NarL/FixJ family response regulator